EIIEDGQTGYLVRFDQHKASPFEPVVPEDFSKDLAQKINRLLSDKPLAQKMGGGLNG
ncbi:MAG: glycogen synthase, partial [Nitrospirae bacterium]|nr:glycogen synthase [Nitrospirota bacterium]